MKQFLRYIFPLVIACLTLAWICKEPSFSKALVKKSDLIFEGKVTSVSKVSPDVNGNELLVTFIPVKIYKGKIRDTIFLRSSSETNGFIERFTTQENYIGKEYLLYVTKKNGLFTFDACESRRVLKSDNGVDHKQDSLYRSEVNKLMLFTKEPKKSK